jgi:ethanolaminephosphotransferase
MNVARSHRGKKGSSTKTLLGLLPFVLQTAINLLWLHSQPSLLNRHLLPFMVYYGLSFAYLVGLLIVSHILKAPEVFPYWNILLFWSFLGFADSHINILTLGLIEQPIFQKSEAGAVKFIWLSILVASVIYAYFVADVILDVCDYCGISSVFFLYLLDPMLFLTLDISRN